MLVTLSSANYRMAVQLLEGYLPLALFGPKAGFGGFKGYRSPSLAVTVLRASMNTLKPLIKYTKQASDKITSLVCTLRVADRKVSS